MKPWHTGCLPALLGQLWFQGKRMLFLFICLFPDNFLRHHIFCESQVFEVDDVDSPWRIEGVHLHREELLYFKFWNPRIFFNSIVIASFLCLFVGEDWSPFYLVISFLGGLLF